MKSIKIIILTLLFILGVTACAENPSPNDESNVKGDIKTDPAESARKNSGGERGVNEGKPTQITETSTPMRDFFLKDGSKAHYFGEGNEFAGYKIEVSEPFENIYVIYENNGGTFIRRTYKVDDNKIEILEETTADYKDKFPSLKEIEAMKPMGIYLQKPFIKGTEFDGWTIIETETTVETPYKTFDDAIVIEMKGKDFVNRKYFVPEYGEVKRESVMWTENNEEVIVTSSLESVEQQK